MKYLKIILILVLFCELSYCQLSLSPLIGVQFVNINQKNIELLESDLEYPLKIKSKPFRHSQLIYGVKFKYDVNDIYSITSKFIASSILKQNTTYIGQDLIIFDIHIIKFRTYETNISFNRKINNYFSCDLGVNYIFFQNIVQVWDNEFETIWELEHDNKQFGLVAGLNYEFKNVELSLSYSKGLMFLEKKHPRQFNPINNISFTVGCKFVPEVHEK